MRRIITVLLIGLFFACDNTVDLTGQREDITIVYGLLDPLQDTNYIRIERAFLGDANALVMAQVDDSLYYDSAIVSLLELDQNGAVLDSFVLTKTINAIPKDTGIFASDNNVLYRSTKTLNQNSTYKLSIIKPLASEKYSSAITPLCYGVFFTYPSSNQTDLNFIDASGNNPNTSTTFTWLPGINANAYQLEMVFRYTEAPTSDLNDKTFKSISRTSLLIEKPKDGSDVSETVKKMEFYNFIAANIEADPDLARTFVAVDLIAYIAGTDLHTFIEQNKPSSGLVPKITDFTNINNGLGVFSTRSRSSITGLQLNKLTKDTLMTGYITGNLNFYQ